MPSTPPIALELPDDASAPGIARRHTAQVLHGWRLTGLLDSALLVTSELVTNAVRYGRRPIRLHLRRVSRDVRIEVADANPYMGEAGRVDGLSESGRGRHIVSVLARESGVDSVPGDGKIAWAVVSDPPVDES